MKFGVLRFTLMWQDKIGMTKHFECKTCDSQFRTLLMVGLRHGRYLSMFLGGFFNINQLI